MIKRLRLLCLVICVTACGEKPAATASQAVVTQVVVDPGSVVVAPGASVQLTARALDAAGSQVASAKLTWRSTDTVVVRVDSTGRATAGVVADSARIIVTSGVVTTSIPVSVTSAAPVKRAVMLGTNLSGIADWSTAVPFVDLMKFSRPWVSNRDGAPFGGGGALAVSPDGWVTHLDPGQKATTLFFSDNGGLYPAGTYVVLYDGTGTLAFPGNSGVSVRAASNGRIELNVVPTAAAVIMEITAVNDNDPLRNIRVLLPNAEATYATQPFNPAYLKVLAPFGVLRFMDMQSTNNSPVREFSELSTQGTATWSGWGGVPPQTMIDLSNTLGADAWFCMPHLASDAFVERFAQLALARLNRSRQVYVEYSNETWNGQFRQAQYALAQGRALALSTNDYQAQLYFTSKRSVEVFRIWRRVFGADSARVVRVMSAQAANAWTGEQELGFRDAWRETDALAIAPYFRTDVGLTGSASAGVVLSALDASIAGDVRTWITANVASAQRFNVTLMAYEGGQHLTSYQAPGNIEPTVTALYRTVNRSPEMGALYGRYLDQWKALGGGVFMNFSDVGAPGKFGFWGAMESVWEPASAAPKYQALLDFIARNPAPVR